ncbi:MAG: hypothetical protein JNM85_07840 [Chthonomonas sp.]|nr:hypothetical protein [Chthonomonas sp.]
MKTIDMKSNGLVLTEEEAFALLNLALTSPQKLDATSEEAIHKLAAFCSQSSHKSLQPAGELERAV